VFVGAIEEALAARHRAGDHGGYLRTHRKLGQARALAMGSPYGVAEKKEAGACARRRPRKEVPR
jgi:hypothetical protein